MVTSSLHDYSDAYILVNDTITKAGAEVDDATKRREKKKGVIFKNYPPFTVCISEISNT